MKQVILIITLLVGTLHGFSQNQFEVLPDKDNGKVFKGIISRDVIEKESSFTWYAENQKGYTPNPGGLTAFKKNVDSVQLVVFMGTWCEDSHNIVPKLFMFADAAGLSNDRITLIGVDRSKKTISHLTEALNIINVPTIIVMKNGHELGRVVEYGKYGLFDKELGEIVSQPSKP